MEPFKRQQKISVIVPVFNEAKSLLSNMNLLIQEVEPHFENYEIIVVSDGSTDETNRILDQHFSDKVRVVQYEKNKGKGYAVRRGFFEANGDQILFIDGGMELHPKEIRIFIGLQELYDADVVLGSKRHPQSQIDYPVVRRVLSACYHHLVQLFFDLDVTDTQVGIKLFRREVIEAIRDDMAVDRYGFDLEMLVLAKHRGFGKMLEAPIRLDYFGQNDRGFLNALIHMIRITGSVALDTIRVWRKVRDL